MDTITDDDLSKILTAHAAWANGDIGGKRADLSDANLSGADLRGADLTGAYLTGADLTRATGVVDLGYPDGWHAVGWWHKGEPWVRLGSGQ